MEQLFQETVNTFVTPVIQTACTRNKIRKTKTKKKKRTSVFKELFRRWGERISRTVSWTNSTWKMEVGRPLKTPVNMYKSTIRLIPHKYRCEKLSRELRTTVVNPLNPELIPICYLLALLGAHYFLHVSRIRVKSLTFRLLMSYIYMEHPFLMLLDHTRRRSTVGRTPLDE